MVAYIMSLVHKIPPIISALAFGYGVGMTAPESAISTVNAAVVTYSQPMVGQTTTMVQPVPTSAAVVPARAAKSGVGGQESLELLRLRDAASRDAEVEREASCSLERPSFSKAPRYESRMGRSGVEVDDLDDASAEALSRLQLPDLRIPVTRRTIKYVRFFTRTDRGRRMYEAWLKRSGRYQDMIQSELRDRRLPEDLIWVSMIESGFDARVKSPAGAVGLWQFMPATGKVYGLEQNRYIDQRKNPRLATQAALHHLRDLYMRFGAWDLALAAYNMGYEQLLDRIDRYGTADFNELARQEAIPSETASYVPKIMAAAIVANNLERFGFDNVELSRPIDAAEIAVPPRTSLKLIAKAAGVSSTTVRKLNPDILSDRLPPGRGDFIIMIPPDTVSRARAALPAMLQDEPLATEDASVFDPVDLVGGRDFVKPRALNEERSLLSLLPRYKKRRTMRDPLPNDNDGPLEEVSANENRAEEASSVSDVALDRNEEREAPPSKSKARRTSKSRSTVMYRIGPGDSLIGIARQFALDVDDISKWNKLESDKLKVGELLKLRVRRDVLRGLQSSSEIEGDSAKDGKEIKPSRKGAHESADAARHRAAAGSKPKPAREKSQKRPRAGRSAG